MGQPCPLAGDTWFLWDNGWYERMERQDDLMGCIEQAIRARQMNEVMAGRTIVKLEQTPHFDTQLRIGFASFHGIDVTGRKIRRVFDEHYAVVLELEPEAFIYFAAVETLYHRTEDTLPKAYGIRLVLDDGASLTIHIPGMQGTLMISERDLYEKDIRDKASEKLNAFGDGFTFDKFKEALFRKNAITCSSFVDFSGIGYLPDVLYTASINPRTKVRKLSEEELQRLYQAVGKVNREMTEQDGDILEKDIYGKNGGYHRKMAGHLSKKPCPVCGTMVQKQTNITGMACYYCPTCQPYRE